MALDFTWDYLLIPVSRFPPQDPADTTSAHTESEGQVPRSRESSGAAYPSSTICPDGAASFTLDAMP